MEDLISVILSILWQQFLLLWKAQFSPHFFRNQVWWFVGFGGFSYFCTSGYIKLDDQNLAIRDKRIPFAVVCCPFKIFPFS